MSHRSRYPMWFFVIVIYHRIPPGGMPLVKLIQTEVFYKLVCGLWIVK